MGAAAMSDIASLEYSLKQQHGAIPVMGAELECYVTLVPEQVEAFWQAVSHALEAAGMPWQRIEKERGTHQYELIFPPVAPARLAAILAAAKQAVEAEARARSVSCSFAARPFSGEPSSGLHIHLHLEDAAGNYLYHKSDDEMSEALAFSLGGLLAGMAQDMAIFCPSAESFTRFEDKDHVPRTFSWGVNNRYAALRIPAERNPYRKRIEHRMAGADADPESVITAILRRVLEGLEQGTAPPPQEYGKPESIFLTAAHCLS
jgi:glutamine synthetase